MSDLSARLAELESGLKRCRQQTYRDRVLAIALAAVCTALFIGGTGESGRSTEEIRTERLTIVDVNGQPRARLHMSDKGPWLGLMDENGKPRAVLNLDQNGPMLTLFDENGKGRVSQAIDKGAGAWVTLSDENGKTRASLLVNKDTGGLTLCDENGKARAVVAVAGGAELVLKDENGKDIWHAP